jgi:hypothetical protein
VNQSLYHSIRSRRSGYQRHSNDRIGSCACVRAPYSRTQNAAIILTTMAIQLHQAQRDSRAQVRTLTCILISQLLPPPQSQITGRGLLSTYLYGGKELELARVYAIFDRYQPIEIPEQTSGTYYPGPKKGLYFSPCVRSWHIKKIPHLITGYPPAHMA